MLFSSDMKKLLRLFEEHSVQYTLVGGHAVNYYSDRPRDLADADELAKINH